MPYIPIPKVNNSCQLGGRRLWLVNIWRECEHIHMSLVCGRLDGYDQQPKGDCFQASLSSRCGWINN